jgi:hypothetical protein
MRSRADKCTSVVSALGATVLIAIAAAVVGASAAPQAGASVSTTPIWAVTETGAGDFNVVSCADAGNCFAIATSTGTDNVVEFDHGKWSSPRQLEQYAGEFVALSCPVVDECVAITDLAGATVFKE